MTTLAEFHTALAQELNKGSTLDAVIPSRARMAARFLEQNYSFEYMKRFIRWTVDENTANGAVFAVPARPKSIEFFRISYTDEDNFRYLQQIDPVDLVKIGVDTIDRPVGYWLDSNTTIYLDSWIQESGVVAEMYYAQYTLWPDVYTGTHKLLDFAEPLFFYQTLIMMSTYVRQPDLIQAYKLLRDEAAQVAISANEEIKRTNKSIAMEYR